MTDTLERIASSGGNGGLPSVKWRGADLIVNHDDGQFANFLDTGKFTQMYRLAEMFSTSNLVPAHFKGQIADCFIGMQMAMRLGVDPFMFLQNTYVVHGRPGMEAKLAIALINSSGLFADSIDYEIEGDDASKPDYRVRAIATRKSTNKVVFGPWIDWKTVKAEKWDGKDGSKWKTIPQLMFQYRAATWFGRLHCPERLMGMQTVDEIDDVGPKRRIDSSVIDSPRGANALADELKARDGKAAESRGGKGENVDTSTGEVIADTEEKIGGTENPHQPEAPQTEKKPDADSQPTGTNDDSQLSPEEKWDIYVGEVREASGIPAEQFKIGLGKFLLSKGKVRKGHELSAEGRTELAKLAKEKSGPFVV